MRLIPNTNITILIFLFCLLGFLPGCKRVPEQAVPHHTFYNNMLRLCGYKYPGTVIYPAGREAPFRGQKLTLVIQDCRQNELTMPLYVGANIFRTWVLGKDKTGLWFRHDNIKNGKHAEISLYGGHTKSAQTPYLVIFPADLYTSNLYGSERNSSWSLAFDNDKSTLSYMAEEDGKLTLQIDFDLTHPVR